MKCKTTDKANVRPYMHALPMSGVKRSKHFFSENSHVAYQIKENDTYNNMQALVLSLHTPSTPRVGPKGQNSFSERKYWIKKLKGMKRAIICKQVCCPYTHPRPLGGLHRSRLSSVSSRVNEHEADHDRTMVIYNIGKFFSLIQ